MKQREEWSDVPSWDEEYKASVWRGRFAIGLFLLGVVSVCLALVGLMK